MTANRERTRGITTPDYVTNTGRVSQAERDRIAELADLGWSTTRTARKLGRSPSVVAYYYITLGYRPASGRRRTDNLRNGRPVRAFTGEEDALLVEMRKQGASYVEIGRELGILLGRPRRPNSVRARVYQLAARDDADSPS